MPIIECRWLAAFFSTLIRPRSLFTERKDGDDATRVRLDCDGDNGDDDDDDDGAKSGESGGPGLAHSLKLKSRYRYVKKSRRIGCVIPRCK